MAEKSHGHRHSSRKDQNKSKKKLGYTTGEALIRLKDDIEGVLKEYKSDFNKER